MTRTRRPHILIVSSDTDSRWLSDPFDGVEVDWIDPPMTAATEGRRTVLVIDSHREHHYLARQARSQALATAHAVTLESALRHVQRGAEPDVVLISYDDGAAEAVEAMRGAYPGVPILLWVEPADVVGALQLVRRHDLQGAVSYSMTPAEIQEEVLRAIERPRTSVTLEIRQRMSDLVERLEGRKH